MLKIAFKAGDGNTYFLQYQNYLYSILETAVSLGINCVFFFNDKFIITTNAVLQSISFFRKYIKYHLFLRCFSYIIKFVIKKYSFSFAIPNNFRDTVEPRLTDSIIHNLYRSVCQLFDVLTISVHRNLE